MEALPIQIILLEDHGDERGSSFSLPDTWHDFIVSVLDLHTMTLRPSQVRGNHYHTERRESIIVYYSDRWSLHWDTGPQTAIQHQCFMGKGAVIIQVHPYISHAIRNDGTVDLYITAFSNRQYRPEDPDSYCRSVI